MFLLTSPCCGAREQNSAMLPKSTQLGPLLIVAAVLLAYCNTFAAPFHFDDLYRIVKNPPVHTLWPPTVAMSKSNRPFAEYTFAINYAIHGDAVWGYHALNLFIHITASLCLYGIVRRTLALLPSRQGESGELLALAIALIWAVHPLQTQAVTYIYQRVESLMALAYLATLYCFIRARESEDPRRWYLGSVAACAYGMGCKEVMVTAPLIVLWYDRAFIAGSWRELFWKRRGYYAGLLATWGVLAWAMLHYAVSYTCGDQISVEGLTPWTYCLSQAGVIVHYLRLCFWPQGQCFDYGWPVVTTIYEVLPQALLIVSLLGTVLWCLFRYPQGSFIGGWFFLILAPTSSILPIIDLAVEHRMYLPLAAVTATAVLVFATVCARLFQQERVRTRVVVISTLSAAFFLAVATCQRNRVYRSTHRLWIDVVAKRPDNARGYYNLSVVFQSDGQFAQALEYCQKAIELDPHYLPAYNNAGAAAEKLGKTSQAMQYYSRVLEMSPEHAQAHFNVGQLLRHTSSEQAMKHFRLALRAKPDWSEAHNNLGAVLARRDPLLAEEHYRLALKYDPRNAEAHNNQANLLVRRGQLVDAIVHYRRALKIKPDFEMARRNLDIIQELTGPRRD